MTPMPASAIDREAFKLTAREQWDACAKRWKHSMRHDFRPPTVMVTKPRRRRNDWRAMLALALCMPLSSPPAAAETCGEVVTLAAHGRSTVAYSIAGHKAQAGRIALVLLPGGPGVVALDAGACARKLRGNSLVRSRELLHGMGFVTALVDAPSDRRGRDGLAGFRIARQHADDIGKVIADVRRRTGAPVWLVGTSRGAISAVNAAGRLKGESAPDGLVLTSPVTSGRVGGRKAWVAQTVLSVPLETITMPLLVVGHAADKCLRSPPHLNGRIAVRARAVREQTVTVSGGPGIGGQPRVEACQGRSPHGFISQEAAVAAGIARFVRGERY